MRRLRGKLNYKQEEQVALSKLPNTSNAARNMGKLRKMKSSIEFRIATEATTLTAERELIKKLNEINKELEEAVNAYRFRRKVELVAKDIDEIGKALESYKNQVLEVDKKLDALYSELRNLTGWKRPEARAGEQPRPRRVQKREEPFEVSLEDIATIKKKEE
ncbi:MAG: hypothetical protein KGI04_04300 [Candidatus Micrarchaeota archaeon]|nr:hypothetical protein [Candidatus Micrarchaeota archaeon]